MESANESNVFEYSSFIITVIHLNDGNLNDGRGDSPLSPIMNRQPVHSPAACQSMNVALALSKLP